jgi:hypothetical protein
MFDGGNGPFQPNLGRLLYKIESRTPGKQCPDRFTTGYNFSICNKPLAEKVKASTVV